MEGTSLPIASTNLGAFGKDQKRQVERFICEPHHRKRSGDLTPVMSGVIKHVEKRACHR